MSKLFEPLKIRSIEFRNRIIVSPMCEYSSVDGFANDWHLVHLGSRAVGGAGLVITEATAVSPEGRISPDDLGIWNDQHIEKLSAITKFVREQGAIVGTQLAHAGRKASCASPWKGGNQIRIADAGWKTVAPSSIPFHETDLVPEELTQSGIEKVILDFKNAAVRAIHAGFQLLEIHAAHGYLIHEFLSPLSNKRTDSYGGSFENRSRILTQVIDAIKEVWPADYPIFVRISATDWAEGGWNIEDSIKLSSILKEKEIDLIDCSSGGLVGGVKIPLGPGYQVPFASRIRKEAGIMTGAVGLITEAKQCEEILEKGEADMIVMAREFLRDPYFPLHAARELGFDMKWPSQYERAKPKIN
ncbi:MAG: NADPH dehydrogenase NamA [Bacteroidetes bacterium]|nr:MAG: NADPH dehydrogenase NamA [Bacteroidota bacterium]